jgi:predicted nuclease of predicted toxin-antitoxin system
VKILFDANTPAPLARFLRGHEVVRADELGWQGMDNRTLLDAAEQAGFDLLLTCDQNVRYQQNFTSRKLAVVILSSNHWPTLRRIAARITRAVDFVQTGQIVKVDIAICKPLRSDRYYCDMETSATIGGLRVLINCVF